MWKLGSESKRLQFEISKVPGPGAYPHKETNTKQTFSFRKTGMAKTTKKTGPGPGAYETKNSIGEIPSYSKP